MPENGLSILLDQNIPFVVTAWLRSKKPSWEIWHVKDLGFESLIRLMNCLPQEEWIESLIIIDNKKIRVRRLTSS